MRVPPQGEASEYTNKRPGENSGPFAANNTHIQFRPDQVTTPQLKAPVKSAGHFYPRSPQGERLYRGAGYLPICSFLSTFPARPRKPGSIWLGFLSTFPLRGTSVQEPDDPRRVTHFYPRSPCGERLDVIQYTYATDQFLSTFPLRGTSPAMRRPRPTRRHFYPRSPCGERLQGELHGRVSRKISIHVPLAGNVRALQPVDHFNQYFYPRSPCGERQ